MSVAILPRRRLCRSLSTYAFDNSKDLAVDEFSCVKAVYRQLRHGLEHGGAKLHVAWQAPARRVQSGRTRRRDCWTDECKASSLSSSISSGSPTGVQPEDASGAHAGTQVVFLEPEAATDPVTSSRRVCVVPHVVAGEPQDSKIFTEILSQTKHPAQQEWENLWYHGASASFQKVAHLFSSTHRSTTACPTESSLSEPTLSTASLEPEDQKLFANDDKVQLTTITSKEKAVREARAEKATDERQRFALLLGLPTFEEYLDKKQIVHEELRKVSSEPSKRQIKRQARFLQKKSRRGQTQLHQAAVVDLADEGYIPAPPSSHAPIHDHPIASQGMTQESQKPQKPIPAIGAEHRPLVVGLRKPCGSRSSSTMATSSDAPALNKEIAENVKSNTTEAAPSADNPTAPSSQKPKKEKAPKQPKPQKQAAPTAPTSPALIDLRVGHILRAIAHPNADSLYVSTIAMGDPEGTEHTQVDEETGKIVRTVCSGLKGLVPLEEMQNRKVIVVANLKPVNMRSIKSAAMVLAASPKQPEGADPHAADRVVELVSPPDNAEAGDKVYFEGWPYGDGRGPEKQLNPKKKQWEAIQPGFFTNDDLVAGFDAAQCEEVDGAEKGNLVVEGKGVCKVKTLKNAVIK